MNPVKIEVASQKHIKYVSEILKTIEDATKVRGTGIAKRKPEYIEQKINEGKAIIAMDGDKFVGFCYIESWDHEKFVANSGLIVKDEYRGQGVAKRIKRMAFELSREKFPDAKIFGLTTGAAVMKINTELGYVPVTFSDLTTDPTFWKGCESCINYDILCRNDCTRCLCTGMLYDPAKHPEDKRKKVVVAYSGGLDTSFTIMYLTKEMGYDVYAACANTGGFSEQQLRENEERAYKLGAKKYVTLDVTGEYYEKSIKYMVYGNVLRNGTYPISVSSERIFQALAVARYAKEIGAQAIAHGSTGAGNDQVRFDMTFLVAAPDMEIITLTRDMNLSRQQEVDYLNQHGFKADFTKLKYSYNVGLWGTSICGGEILDSKQGLPETAYLKQVTKDGSEQISLEFKAGVLVGVNGEKFDDGVKAVQKVESIAAPYGVGRDMHVGDTIVGIKGRVGFEAAAPMLIIAAHKFLEKFTLSKWQQYWKDQVANWYGMFLHESQYLEPVMRDIEAMLESSQRNVNGTVTMELRPYGFSTVGVDSPDDLVKNKLGEYGEGAKGWTSEDAKGFIKVSSTPLRAYYLTHPDEGEELEK
ncbi:MAG: GNAT family N-acetyltransferase [Bacteroidales bacterium]|jgi:Argininosuccinate synthase|nr:GNAT family N-acetyltransferase [Bacteroidales bacterium]